MIKYLVNAVYNNGNITFKDFWFDDFDKAIEFVKNLDCYQWSIKKLYKTERN